MTVSINQPTLARRRADNRLSGTDPAPRIVEAPLATGAASLFARIMQHLDVLRGSYAAQPMDIQEMLAAPLFERTASMLLAHGGSILLCFYAALRCPGRWPDVFLAGNIILVACRLFWVRHVAGLRAAGHPHPAVASLRVYMAIGIAWAGLNGMLAVFGTLPANGESFRVLVAIFVLGIASGVAARSAGTPRFAIAIIALWVLPQTLEDLRLGGANAVLAVLICMYFAALTSIVRQLHGDMLRMIRVQRGSAALAARFDAALSNMTQGLILYDSEGMLRVVNRRFFTLFGLLENSLVSGQSAVDVAQACMAAGTLTITSGCAASLESLATMADTQGVLELADGRAIALSRESLPDGGSISTYEDITERRINEARIAHMALHDALTDMPNRLLFRDRLDQAVARLGRGEAFAVACLDLDHFKAVNDTLGHNMGDRLLQVVATRLACCLREVDLVARLGGDEFAVLLPGITEPAEAQIVARRLIDTVAGAYDIGGASMTIGVSIGMALAPRDGANAETLLMHADLAMYAAKGDGRGGLRLFEADLSTRLSERQDLERDIRLGLAAGQFELYYQPIVSLASGRVTGFEALLRWHHPQRGLLSPDSFITVAEDSGLIVPLGAWVIETACRQAASWPEPVSVAVNLSPVQFRAAGLLDCMLAALRQSGLPPAQLEVEITEAAILGETEATLAALRHLRVLGVRIAFDDFGTGFSSLSYLHRFAFDKIKIDRSFIVDLENSDSALAIVGAIAGLGASLSLVTTAEGVETQEQLDQIRLLGCTEVQGYLFGRPAPHAEVPHLLQTRWPFDGKVS